MTTPTSFADAYRILKNNADRLEYNEEVDIDNLVQIVDESIQAYKYCQARIDAVEAALNQALNSNVCAADSPNPKANNANIDDGIDDKNLPF